MPTPIAVGVVVWERQPDDTTNLERRGGMVVARRVDHDSGELESVTVINSTMRHGAFEMVRHELAAGTVDRDTVEPATRERLYRFAAGCCRHIGAKQSPVVGYRLWLLEVAVGLCGLAAEMTAADSAARLEAKEAS
jgi:hypothetical protein